MSELRTIQSMDKLKRFPNFDYRVAMRQLFVFYNTSKSWEYVVKAVRTRDKNKCVDCGETGRVLIVHHTSYDSWGLGDWREIEDCVLVCRICHNKRHWNNSVEVPFWASFKRERTKEMEESIQRDLKGFDL